MARIWVPKAKIDDGTLPPVCVVCGREAHHRRFAGVTAPSLAWVLFAPILGLITFWCCVLGGRLGSGDAPGGLPFCDRHRNYWPRRARFIVGGFALLIVTMTAGMMVTETPPPGKDVNPHWLFGVGACWMLIFLPSFLLVHLTAMRPVSRTATKIELARVSRTFAEAVRSIAGPE